MMYDIQQIMLSNGTEVITDVMDWSSDQLIVRNSMQIEKRQVSSNKSQYFFAPWIHYLENNIGYTSLNKQHIVSINQPHFTLIEQYRYAVEEMHYNDEQRTIEFNRAQMVKLKELSDSLFGPNDSSINYTRDSESTNVIKFPVH